MTPIWITAQLAIFIETHVKAYVLLAEGQKYEEQHAYVIAKGAEKVLISQPVESSAAEMLLIVTNILIFFAC